MNHAQKSITVIAGLYAAFFFFLWLFWWKVPGQKAHIRRFDLLIDWLQRRKKTYKVSCEAHYWVTQNSGRLVVIVPKSSCEHCKRGKK